MYSDFKEKISSNFYDHFNESLVLTKILSYFKFSIFGLEQGFLRSRSLFDSSKKDRSDMVEECLDVMAHLLKCF